MRLPNDQITALFRKSGKTQEAFCDEHGITIHKLRYYLYKRGARRHTPAVKTRIAGFSAISTTAPSDFISFNRHPNDDCITHQPVMIVTGQFSIAEIIELVTKTGAAAC